MTALAQLIDDLPVRPRLDPRTSAIVPRVVVTVNESTQAAVDALVQAKAAAASASASAGSATVAAGAASAAAGSAGAADAARTDAGAARDASQQSAQSASGSATAAAGSAGQSATSAAAAAASATSAAQVSPNRTYAALIADTSPDVGTVRQVLVDPGSGTYEMRLVGGTKTWVRTGSTVVGVDARAAALEDTVAGLGATGIGVAVPLIDDWAELFTDILLRPSEGRKVDGSWWKAVNGVMMPRDGLPRDAAGITTIPDLRLTGAFFPPSDAGLGVAVPSIEDWLELFLDATGRPVRGQKVDGSFWIAVAGFMVRLTGAGGVQTSLPVYDYKVTTGRHLLSSAANTDYLVLLIGQSWAEGASFDSDDATVTTTAQHPGAALMFNVGTNPDGRAVTGYVDLVEAPYNSLSKETSLSGMADVIMTRLQADLGRKPRIVFAVAGRGGTAYYGGTAADEGMKRGSANYTEAMRLVSEAKRISALAGRNLEVLCIVFHHGEQDFTIKTPKSLYQRGIDQLQMSKEEDFRAITGQTTRIRMYVTQVNRATPNVIGPPADEALAQLAAEDRNPMVRCLGSTYQGPPSNDFAHLKARGFRWIGCLGGHFIANDLFGPYEQPLRVIERWWVSATVFRLRYSKPIALETDDSRIRISTLGPGKGVTFLDGSGSPPTVTGIAVASDATDTLEVTLSAAPSGKRPRVFVASYRPEGGSGCTLGPRSGIRAASAFWTDSLTSTDLYQWACHEAHDLPVI